MRLIKAIYCKITSRVRNSIVDKTSSISYNVKFYDSSIGKCSYVSNNCNVFHTVIGKFTSIGLGCNIGGGEHPIDWVSSSPTFTKGRTFKTEYANLEFMPYRETIIGNDVYIGACVIIKSGVKIGNGAVIGAGSVVTKDVGEYEVWAGNPARFIRDRFDNLTKRAISDSAWWDWDDELIKEKGYLFNNAQAFINCIQGEAK